MEKLKTLEEHTTKLEAVANLHPNRLVIKCNQVPTKGHDRGEKIFIANGTRRVKQIQNCEKIAHGLLVRAPEVEFVADEISEAQTADPDVGKPNTI